jgi:hypothetical protein
MQATTEEVNSKKRGRPARSIDEEIQAVRERLLALEQKKKERDEAERARAKKAAQEATKKNTSDVTSMLKKEGLFSFGAEAWKSAMPEIRTALQKFAESAPLEKSTQ